MMQILLSFLILLVTASPAWAKCDQEEVCAMARKMNPFAVLEQCPDAGPILKGCRRQEQLEVIDLPHHPKFVDNGDGTVTDQANGLLWAKTEASEKRMDYREARAFVSVSEYAGQFRWRFPTLSELKSLMIPNKLRNESGKLSFINPVFNDGLRWNQYWTSTSCIDVTIHTDKFGPKKCQEGESGRWFVHFKLGTISWSFETARNWVWLVKDLKEKNR